jgi:hypothetical protein
LIFCKIISSLIYLILHENQNYFILIKWLIFNKPFDHIMLFLNFFDNIFWNKMLMYFSFILSFFHPLMLLWINDKIFSFHDKMNFKINIKIFNKMKYFHKNKTWLILNSLFMNCWISFYWYGKFVKIIRALEVMTQNFIWFFVFCSKFEITISCHEIYWNNKYRFV